MPGPFPLQAVARLRPALRRALCVALGALPVGTLAAQDSRAALAFHALGAGQDRARFPLDDDAPGVDASQPHDVGRGDFTLELWVRGDAAANASTPSAPGSFADQRWRQGRVLLDRSPSGPTGRGFAVALCAGSVSFYTGPGDGPQADLEDTTVGARSVLDGTWHHVAVVRDATSGEKRIVIDGALDRASPLATSSADLSYPDDGVPGAPSNAAVLVLGAARDDGSAGFAGRCDELRVWERARTTREIAGLMYRRLLPDTPGLAAEFRFEAGAGTVLADTSDRAAAAGVLVAGVAGNGEWTHVEADANDVAPVAGSLPLGFERELVVPQLDHPTALEFAPDGRIFVAELGGRVRIVTNGALLAQPLCELPVATGGERGLLGLAVDPEFAQNGWLYVFRTTPALRNRVSRLTVVGDTAALASEFLVWETPAAVAYSHHGGALEFGADGKLYVATGDQFVSSTAQDLSSPHGKLLRLDRDGSVPADNPFVGTPGARPEIWALGLRNPFRFRLDAASGRLWLGDVGGNGPAAFEELDVVERGANFGWPLAEGPACYQSDCSTLRACRFAYRHDEARFGGALQQGCVVAGPVLHGGAFPAEYEGNLIVGDFANGWLWRLELDANGQVAGAHPLELGNDTGAVVDLDQGPDGSLYVLTHVRGTLARIRQGSGANLMPVPIASADRVHGVAPLRVQFQGSASYDPDQGPGPLAFQWLFGDGASSTAADPQHVYGAPGEYHVALLVGDGVDLARAADLVVTVGHPPVAAVATPAPGTLYRAGDTIAFSGGATDAEDGVLAPAALTWRVLLVHEEHEHPFLGPLTGVSSGSFTIPSTGHGPEHTHYRIELEARDADGLVATASVAIEPRTSPLAFRSLPVDVPLLLDGEPIVPPLARESLEGFAHTVEAPERFVLAGRSYVFDYWSNGDLERATTLVAPAGGATLDALFHIDEVAEIDSGVYAVERNAEWRDGGAQAPSCPLDANAICVGGEGGGAVQAAFAFPLPLERGVEVLSARLRATAAPDQSGAPALQMRAYAVADAPPFEFGSSTALTAFAPLATAQRIWTGPVFLAGDAVESPELAPLVQELVNRADWIAGDRIGLVLSTRSATSRERRCFANFDSGAGPVLHVRWRTARPDPTLPPLRY